MPDELIKKKESVFKRLTRLFKSGPVVRHKIAGGSGFNEPQGTAKAYKKELSSLYVNSLASYGQYERLARYADFCLAGETYILTENGPVQIKEIVKNFNNNKKIKVFAFDNENLKTCLIEISNAKLTGKDPIWKITLTSGFSVKCNATHPFMTVDGSYIKAKDLKNGILLVPKSAEYCEQRVEFVEELSSYDNEYVYDITVPKYHNFAVCDKKVNNIIYLRNSEMEFTPEVACVSIDSIINTPAGDFTIKKLLSIQQEQGDNFSFPVYCFDEKLKKLTIGNAHSIRKTKRDVVYKIEFDSGESIKCTGDHLFLTRKNEWIQAKDLFLNDSLMPFYRKNNKQKNGYFSVYTVNNGWELEHRFVAREFILNRQFKQYPEEIIHHKDLNKHNNSPDNLLVCTVKEHNDIHGREWNGYTDRTIEIARKIGIANKGKIPWNKNKKGLQQHTVESKEKISKAIKKLFKDKDYRKRALSGMISWIKSPEAKKIISKRYSGKRNPRYRHDIKTSEVLQLGMKYEKVVDFVKSDDLDFFDNIAAKRAFIISRISQAGYNHWNEYKDKFNPTNHKVISITKLKEKEDVYDITTDKYHNFACNGVIIHNSAIDIYADESTSPNAEGKVLDVISDNDEIKQTLETLFFDIINIDFNLWSWTRNLVKFGDFILFVDASDTNGILNLLPIPINEIEREEGYNKDDPFAVRFRWLTQGNMILENWQVIHFRLLGNDSFLPYGSSVIEPARRIWRQLILIEDAMLVYRIIRSPERRVFYIDVGNIPPDKIETHMEQIMTRLKRSQIVDNTTGRIDLRYNPLCFFPNDFIYLCDGTQLEIKNCVDDWEKYKNSYVWSMDKDNNIIPTKLLWAGKTKENAKFIEVELDDGQIIKTTHEHKWVMRNGNKCRADKLKIGDSLMPFYATKYCNKFTTDDNPYIVIYNPGTKEYKTGHKIVGTLKYGDYNFPNIIHHKNHIKIDNNFDNLQIMSQSEHAKLHKDIIINYNKSVKGRKKSSETMKKTHSRYDFNKISKDLWKNKNIRKKRVDALTLKIDSKLIYYVLNCFNKLGTSVHEYQVREWLNNNNEFLVYLKDINKDFKNGFSNKLTKNQFLRLLRTQNFDNLRELKDFYISLIAPWDKIIKYCNINNPKSRKEVQTHFKISKYDFLRLIKRHSLTKDEFDKQFIDNGGYYSRVIKDNIAEQQVSLNHKIVNIKEYDGVSDAYGLTVENSNHTIVVTGYNKKYDPKVSEKISGVVLCNSVDEDYFLPVRGDKGSRIETLSGGQFTGDIDDVNYIQSKLFAALKVPKAYLGYEEQLGCLRANVKIKTLSGISYTIPELIDRKNKSYIDYIYSITKQGKLIPAKINKAWATKQVDKLIRVKLDNNKTIDVTDNHLFMMRDGTYRRADELKSLDSLMPLYTKLSAKDEGNFADGYEMIFDNESCKWIYTHRLVKEELNIKQHKSSYDKNEGWNVTHHVDTNRLNNDPSNLLVMGRKSHAIHHSEKASILQEEWCRDKLRDVMKTDKYRDAHKKGVINKWANDCGARKKKLVECNKEYKKQEKMLQAIQNKITSGELKLSGKDSHNWKQRPKLSDIVDVVSNGTYKINEVRDELKTSLVGVYEIIKKAGYPTWGHFTVVHDLIKVRQGRPIRLYNEALSLGLVNNHKVVSTEVIFLDKSEWVYDIEVNNNGLNEPVFALENGICVHNSKATLAQEDVRFSRTISRVQKIIVSELNKIAIIHLFLLGYEGEDLIDFELKLSNPSTIAEQQRLELWRSRFEVASTAVEGMLDRKTVYQKILNMSDNEISIVSQGKKDDKLEDLALEGMTIEPAQGEGLDSGEEGEALPGEDELPDTLGGESGVANGEDTLDAISSTEEALYHDAALIEDEEVDEKINKGSKGNDASISVNKGKDLFNTGEDQFKLAFGTEKQAASDPYDKRYLKSLITRPLADALKSFSKQEILVEQDEVDEKISSAIDISEDIENDMKLILPKIDKL